MDKKNMVFSFNRHMKKIKQKMALIANFILLSLVYFIGVGFTSIVAGISGKSFLFNKNKKQSSFAVFKKANNLERMF